MLSVALCTYNGSKYIHEQIASILHQTKPVDEIVVCDDGSTDNTLEIIEGFRQVRNPDIRIYRNEKKLGVRLNFQKAIGLCKGDVIFLSDQDDIWHPDKVKTICDYFSAHEEVDVAFSDGDLIDEQGTSVGTETLWNFFGLKPHGYQSFQDGLGVELLASGNRVTGATMAIRRRFEYLLSFVDCCSVDMLHDETIALLALEKKQLGIIPDTLMSYRVHGDQQCGVGKLEEQKLSEDPRVIDSYVATRWNQQHLPPSIAGRISFIVSRYHQHKRFFGFWGILGNVRNYRKYYHQRWFSFMCYDLKRWLV